jgi:two-component system sensor histidine kinase/response regulator
LRAVELCAQSNFDLVLMDVQMPIMDGLAATREIRRQEGQRRSIPIIALTASAMTDELDRCVAAGMDGLLTKPLEPLRLREVMDRHGLRSPRDAAREPVHGQSPPGGVAALDIARLRTLLGDDAQFLKELCQTFMTSSTGLIEELRQAAAAEDRTQLRALAHKLKGGAGSACAQRISELCHALEHTALSAPLDELTAVVEQLDAALRDCASVIEAYVP